MWPVAALAVVAHGANAASRRMGDFAVYHRAARRLLAGEAIYRLEDAHRYLYAPVLTVLFVPLAPLPELAAKLVWYSLNVLIVVLALRRSAAIVFPRERPPAGFFVLLFLFSARFIDNNLGHGQINFVMFWWMLEAYALASKERFGLAGLALASAIVTKVVPVVLLVQLLLRRQWRFAAATVGALAALTLLPFLWWGAGYVDVLAQWSAVVRDQVGHYDMGNKINQSISAFVYRAFGSHEESPGVISTGVAGLTTVLLHGAFLAPALWLSFQRGGALQEEPQGRRGDELSLYLIYVTVASPYSWKYYFANLTLPIAALLRGAWARTGRRVALVTVVVALLNWLPGTPIFGKAAGRAMQLLSFHFLAAAVLAAVIASWSLRSPGSELPERPR
jgi:hypothetical protein